MKTITYNEQTHVLVPREPTRDMVIAGTHQRFRDSYDAEEDCYRAMLAAAPQPEPVDGKPVEYLLDGARFKLSFQEIECDECGTESPYVLVTPLDQYANELNGKWVALVPAENDRHLHMTPPPDRTAELEQLRQRVAELEDERDAALARLSEERDIWDGMLGDAADKIAHLELELDDCLYVLDALWDKQCNKIVTQKWAEILIRNKRDIGALSAGDSCQQSTE